MAKISYFDTAKVIWMITVFALAFVFMSCGDKKRDNSNLVNPWEVHTDTMATAPLRTEPSRELEPTSDLGPKASSKEGFLSGVVLIRTMYYYKMSFGDVLDVYFSDVDENGAPVNPTPDINDVTPKVAFGTGFLVNGEGLIATNSHVANPSVDAKKARSSFLTSLSSYSSNIQGDVNDLNTLIGYMLYKVSDSNVSETGENYIKNLIDVRDQKQNVVNAINLLQGQDCCVKCVARIGIAFNNTYVTDHSDFLPCVLKKEDKENDLALIQLKHKQTDVPSGSYIFEVPAADVYSGESNTMNVGTELTMLAFNRGLSLATVEDGIMAQITSGKVTQAQNKIIMYDISSLPGSSGAPVIDEWGNLVAVNFAGISSTQGFNYGIKVYLLRRLLDKD